MLIIFAIPMLIGNVFQQMYNLVDSVIVGKYVGADALAAIGATSSMNFLIFSLCGGMANGIGIIISSMTTKYRDLSILVGFGVQLWMYATPVVYPLSQLGEGILKTILKFNPVTAPIELFRYAVLGQGHFDGLSMLTSWIFTMIVIVFGIMVFNRVEKTFMDTV